jgi:hypothetical protein
MRDNAQRRHKIADEPAADEFTNATQPDLDDARAAIELAQATRLQNRRLALKRLRTNGISMISLPLAAAATYRTTLGVFDLPRVQQAVTSYNETHPYDEKLNYHSTTEYNAIWGGYLLAFMLYMLGSMALADRRVARLMSVLPFTILMISSIGYIIYEILFGVPRFSLLLVAFFLVGLPGIAVEFLWTVAFSASEAEGDETEQPLTTAQAGANSRYAEGRNPDIQQEDF